MRLILAGCLLTGSLVWAQANAPKVTSHVAILNIETGAERELWSGPRHFEAPNWSPDGKYLLLNSGGKLWRFELTGGEPKLVDTGSVDRVNNDHGISPDGKTYVISAGQMYVLPARGGTPRQVTQVSPSYYHGWSPDGKWLAYCAPRQDNFDIYRIAVEGGAEQRLTTHPGYDDGPDYSPDGKWIYFNSDRSGSWDIWRIPANGGGPNDGLAEQVTNDEREDWFPHPSPDGKWIVLVSFEKGTKGHPANHNVVLRKFPMPKDRLAGPVKPVEIRKLFGGQGTINVNSWSPDSKQFAFVWYELK